MKEYFTPEQIQQQLNKIYIEEDDLWLEGEFVEGQEKHYVITGTAIIDGERYHEFEIEFELVDLPKQEILSEIMNIDWDWYDYLC